MGQPEDLTGALRAVWEVRQAEERRQQCLGGWYNIVFGAMAMVIFAGYGLVYALGIAGLWVDFLWAPPVIGAYALLAFVTKTALGLPRPALQWRHLIPGTALMVVMFTLLGIAFGRGLVNDYPAGVTLVIGLFYVVLGTAWIREASHALFGTLLVLAAAAMLLLHVGMMASTLWGIVGTGGGMVLLGLYTLRYEPPPAAPPPQPGAPEPGALEQVRDTLGRLRDHDRLVEARRRAAMVFLSAAFLAVMGLLSLGLTRSGVLMLALAGLVAVWGKVRLAREEATHGR